MIHQSMSAKSADVRINQEAQKYGLLIRNEEWTLEYAGKVLADLDKHNLDLFQIAGLAKALICFQCSVE